MGIFKTLKRKYIKSKELLSKNQNLRLIKKNILITGANSGLGLSIFKKIVNENNILAFVNKNSDQAEKFKNDSVTILKCDLSDINNLASQEQKIIDFKPNIIINCAAIFGDTDNFNKFDFKKYHKVLNINSIAPIVISKMSLKSNTLEQIINISSEMGSSNLNKSGNYFYYRSSKKLINSFSQNFSIEFKNKINLYCIHPGSVKTKMNTGGIINPDYAAQKIIDISVENDENLCGVLIDLNKNILPW